MFVRLMLLISMFALAACEGTMETELEATHAALDGKADSAEPAPVVSTRKPPTQQTPSEPAPESAPAPETQPEDPTTPAPEPTPEDPAEPGKVITFTIQMGTGSGRWNSMETAPLVYVGQVLRIINDDIEPHQLHVPSGGPFRHGQPIPPGAQVEYLVETAWPLEAQARMYDHVHGTGAGFWMQAVE